MKKSDGFVKLNFEIENNFNEFKKHLLWLLKHVTKRGEAIGNDTSTRIYQMSWNSSDESEIKKHLSSCEIHLDEIVGFMIDIDENLGGGSLSNFKEEKFN